MNAPTTPLSKGQQVAYQRWLADNNIQESDDYDMPGYWKQTGFQQPTHTGHFSDTYKKLDPFGEGDHYQQLSEESKYSGNPGYRSGINTSFDKRGQGYWEGDTFVAYAHGGDVLPQAAFGGDPLSQPPIGPFSQTMMSPEQQWSQNLETGFGQQQPMVTQWNEQNQQANESPFKFTAGPGGGGGGKPNAADKLLGFLGGFNDMLEARQQKKDWNALQQKMGRTENMGVNNPLNPFGNYTPNVGLGNNFQPGRQTPVQQPGFHYGGELDTFPDGGQTSTNKTQQYLRAMQSEEKGQQEFWGQAIDDIDHPLEPSKRLTYQQLKQLVQGPQRKEVLERYAQQQNLSTTPSAEQYLQHHFDQGRQRLYQRAAQNPDRYAFPQQAAQARDAVLEPQYLAGATLEQPDFPGQMSNPRMLQQYYQRHQTEPSSYVAPGMSQAQRKFEAGGEYQLSHAEIEDLRRQGYEVELVG